MRKTTGKGKLRKKYFIKTIFPLPGVSKIKG
jgi:hypothetical protein